MLKFCFCTCFAILLISLNGQRSLIDLCDQSVDRLCFSIIKSDNKISLDRIELLDEELISIYQYNIQDFDTDNLEFDDLKPATIYTLRSYFSDTSFEDHSYITNSLSSGEIEYYFNHSLEEGNGTAIEPNGTTFGEVEKAVKDLIKSAVSTIDYCAYNTNVTSIVNNLIDAASRGVRVRVITDKGTSNSGLQGSLPFKVLKGNDEGIMHNKFISIDASSVEAKLVTGSMNFTASQMQFDPNHLMIIHDQSLAKAYEKEFEEMWGSSSAVPNLSLSKFGEFKTDNTPHLFTIGEIPIELYFSPSDHTSSYIKEQLRSADESIDAGLLLFTFDELKDEMVEANNRGDNIRVIIDDPSYSQSVINDLVKSGVSVSIHEEDAIFHYKMAIVDANVENSNPTLVTGSHNWTWSAENINDENTLIIHDAKITQLFERAFIFWWHQLSTSTIQFTQDNVALKNTLWSGNATFENLSNESSIVNIFDALGRKLESREISAHSELELDVANLISGTYICEIRTKDKSYFQKVVKL